MSTDNIQNIYYILVNGAIQYSFKTSVNLLISLFQGVLKNIGKNIKIKTLADFSWINNPESFWVLIKFLKCQSVCLLNFTELVAAYNKDYLWKEKQKVRVTLIKKSFKMVLILIFTHTIYYTSYIKSMVHQFSFPNVWVKAGMIECNSWVSLPFQLDDILNLWTNQ